MTDNRLQVRCAEERMDSCARSMTMLDQSTSTTRESSSQLPSFSSPQWQQQHQRQLHPSLHRDAENSEQPGVNYTRNTFAWPMTHLSSYDAAASQHPALDLLSLSVSNGFSLGNSDSQRRYQNSPQVYCSSVVEPPVATNENADFSIPCRARGMTSSHNFLTAYLTITSKTKHGDGLVCAHETCRNGGIKFIYCNPCKRAVSKRLFRAKHKNCESGQISSGRRAVPAPPGSVHVCSLTASAPVAASASSTMPSFANVSYDSPEKKASSHSTERGGKNNKNTNADYDGKRKLSRDEDSSIDAPDMVFIDNASDTSDPSSNITPSDDDESKEINKLAKRFLRKSATMSTGADQWTNLLLMRPSNSSERHMSAWMHAAVLASECRSNSNNNDTGGGGDGKSSALKRRRVRA